MLFKQLFNMLNWTLWSARAFPACLPTPTLPTVFHFCSAVFIRLQTRHRPPPLPLPHPPPQPASGVSPRKITAVFAAIFATCNRCIWRLHGGNRRWDINTHYTLILAVRRQSPCSSSSSGSSFSLSHSFATDFRRLFSNIIDNNRRPCAPGCTPAHGRWVRRAIWNTGLSESVSVSLGSNRLGQLKQCKFAWTLRSNSCW